MLSTNLTVIVPTLNSHNILCDLVHSFKIQTLKSWEVIFVDGNSEYSHLLYLKNICKNDKRFKWIKQSKTSKGIFGAMNDGNQSVDPNNWILYLGSDDKLANKYALSKLKSELDKSLKKKNHFDVLFCRCRYTKKGILGRKSYFSLSSGEKIYSNKEINKSLFYGSTPPHQGVIVGPKARKKLPNFSDKYRIASDLDYLLQISLYKDLKFKSIKLELILCASEGISHKQTYRRIYEVIKIYFKRYKFFFFISFFTRYIRRIVSKFYK